MYLIDTNVWLELLEREKAEEVRLFFNATEQYGCVLVSFDHDFDHTALDRKAPAQIVNE